MGWHCICVTAILVCSLVATSIGELLPSIDDAVLREAWLRAERSVEPETTRNENKYAERSGSADGLRSPEVPREETLRVWRKAEVFSRAVDHVCETQNLTRPVSERLVERAAPRPTLDPNEICRRRRFNCRLVGNAKYRSIDGSCNNIANPDWGMTVSRMARLLDPVYADGVQSFRQSVGGGPLPLARLVSTMVIPDVDFPDRKGTHMLVFFGQFLDHDLTSTPHRTDLNQCCGVHGNNADCVPIQVPTNDPQLAIFHIGCMEFARSHRACGNGARQQINQNTAFIDGSQIYGSTESEMNNLRTFRGGLLKSSTVERQEFPPQNAGDQTCVKPQGSNANCFIAGDNRANENPGLSAMHVVFLREHNRIARELSRIRNYNDETLFQEARRIVIAEIQNIVYDEFIPTLLSQSTMNDFALGLPTAGLYSNYDASVNPTTVNSFSTAAYRFLLSLIQGQMNMDGLQPIDLAAHFNNPTTLHAPAGVERLLVGAANQPSQRMDNFVTKAVSQQAFSEANNPFGMDLVAITIQRGRDHGLPPYNRFRTLCKLPAATSEADLKNFFIDNQAPGFFMAAYNNSIDDIDLWPGGVAEKPKDEGMIGPTFSCILAVQFNRLMWGDRFFFTHRGQAGSFNTQQLTQLRKRTLASIMCDNLQLNRLQPSVFRAVSSSNAAQTCTTHPKLDLSLF